MCAYCHFDSQSPSLSRLLCIRLPAPLHLPVRPPSLCSLRVKAQVLYLSYDAPDGAEDRSTTSSCGQWVPVMKEAVFVALRCVKVGTSSGGWREGERGGTVQVEACSGGAAGWWKCVFHASYTYQCACV